jgi:hypothetical protein
MSQRDQSLVTLRSLFDLDGQVTSDSGGVEACVEACGDSGGALLVFRKYSLHSLLA